MIIGITGRIAAGKETLTHFFRNKGFIYFETSQLLSKELAKRGLEINRWNLQNIGDELRKKFGKEILMKKLLENTEPDKNYIFDSIRNTGEVEFLKKNVKNFVLIAIDAEQRSRFERLLKRNKPSDPKTWEEFLRIDERDFFDESNPFGQQVKKCMELADFKIDNTGLKNSRKEIEKIWEKIKTQCF